MCKSPIEQWPESTAYFLDSIEWYVVDVFEKGMPKCRMEDEKGLFKSVGVFGVVDLLVGQRAAVHCDCHYHAKEERREHICRIFGAGK